MPSKIDDTESVSTTLSYFNFLPIHEVEKPYEILINLPENAKNIQRSNFAFADQACRVENVRSRETEFSLDNDGFCWRKHKTGVQDLRNRELIEKQYFPEMEEFLRFNIEGNIRKIHFFDFRLRLSMPQEEFSKRTIDLDDGLDPLLPATHPHIDQSPVGAAKRCYFHLPDEAEELMKGRFRIINIWRPLKKIESWPLAVCTASSVDATDLIPNDLVRRKYVGEALYARYNPKHQWKYLAKQRPDEITMLKVYDSSQDVSAKFCLHTGFRLSENDLEVVRESLEIRALVFDYPED